MGKSRLVAEFVRAARRSGHLVAFGECQAFGSNTAYFVFQEVWRRLFVLEDGDPEAAQIAQVESRLARIDKALVARAPLLGAVLGLPIPETELTTSFDAKLRKASLEDLLATCLAARTRDEPLVIVLEDCHWIDELSLDLLASLTRGAGSLRVLFVLAYRPRRRGRQPRAGRAAVLRRDRAGPAGRGGRRAGGPLQARAGRRSRAGGLG